MWSSTRISSSASAAHNRSVMRRSALLGSATPDGWLWANITAAAPYCKRPDRHFSRIDRCTVQRAEKQVFATLHPMLAIEKDTGEHLTVTATQMVLQEKSRRGRAAQHIASAGSLQRLATHQLDGCTQSRIFCWPDTGYPNRLS
jgi:hypothetical protein